MGATSTVSGQIVLSLNDQDIKQRNAAAAASYAELFGGFERVGSILAPVNAGLGQQSDALARMESILENTGLRVNDLAVRMSGLFAAQSRLKGASRSTAKAVADSWRDIADASEESSRRHAAAVAEIGRSMPERSIDAATGDSSAARELLSDNLTMQELITEEIRRRENRLQSSVAQQAELKRLLQEQKDLEQEIVGFENERVAAEGRAAQAAQEVLTDKKQQAAAEERAAKALKEAVAAQREAGGRVSRKQQEANAAIAPEDVKSSSQLEASLRRQNAEADSLYNQYKKVAKSRSEILKTEMASEESLEHQNKLEKKLDDVNKRRKETKKQLEAAQRREEAAANRTAKGYEDALGMLSRLGSQSSINSRIALQQKRNADEFAEAMRRAAKDASRTKEELEAMQAEFDKINTTDAVRSQLSISGGMNNIGAAAQQAAYGVEDFASQMERGFIPALGGAANNINMVVSMLTKGNIWAIGISTGVIAAIQLAKAFGWVGDETNIAAQEMEQAKAKIDALTDAAKRFRETAQFKIDVGFEPSLESVFDRYSSTVNAIADLQAELNNSMKDVRLERINSELDDLTSFSNKALQSLKRFSDWANPFGDPFADELYAEYLRRLELEKQRAELGDDLTDAQREQLSLQQQIAAAEEEMLAAEKAMSGLRKQAVKDILGNVIPPDAGEDGRSALDIKQEAVRLDKVSQGLAEGLLDTRQRLAGAEKSLLEGRATQAEHEEYKKALIEIETEQLRQQAEVTKELAQLAADHVKKLQEAIEAQKEIGRLVEDQQAIGDKDAERLNQSRQAMEGLFEALEKVRKGQNGAAEAAKLYKQYMSEAAAAHQRRLNDAKTAGQAELDLADQILDKQMEQFQAQTDVADAQAKRAAGMINEEESAARQLAAAEKFVAAEERLAELRTQTRSALESAQDMIEARYAAINKEYAVEKKIADERERLNKALQAGIELGLDPAVADQMRLDFEASVIAAERIAEAQTKKKRLEKDMQEKVQELTAATQPVGESRLAERGSAEAQSIIERAAREGNARADQQPIINELVQIKQGIDNQTGVIKNAQQSEPTTTVSF